MDAPTPAYSAATGYSPDFLPVPVELPSFPTGRDVWLLPYIHFTVLLDPVRRLPAATGVNIDGAQLLDIERGDDWPLAPRVRTSRPGTVRPQRPRPRPPSPPRHPV